MNINGILNDKSTSYWLKNALTTALERDPADALDDIEILHGAMQQHFEEICLAGTIATAKQIKKARAVFPGLNKFKSECETIIINNNEEWVVILKELKDNPGTSVTNAFEIVATLLVNEKLKGIDPASVAWIGYSEDSPGKYDLVKLEWSGKEYSRPEWAFIINKELVKSLDVVING